MLILHRAERTDVLADALGEVLAKPLDDPFAPEVVAVPARGIERWLTQRLSGILGAPVNPRRVARVEGDGVAANIRFPSSMRLVDEALAAASGIDADDDPWHPSRMLWTLLDVIDECVGEPWCATLARHLGNGSDDHRAGRRYATAAHLTALLRSYGLQRPEMIARWAAGEDTDGTDAPLDDHLRWQAELWRRLRARIGADSPAQRLGDLCARLRAEPDVVDLPERLSVFGPTRLDTVRLDVLSALAEHRDVHVWLPHPSPVMWQNLAGRPSSLRRADDRSALRVRHPLLAALGRDVREFEARLSALDCTEIVHPSPEPPATLLGRLQADLRDDRAPGPGSATADGTVVIHACHGPTRQVEVLRESLLHLFQDDPTLEPRDVVVMCPDVETYAPLVHAAFGAGVGEHPGHTLRVRLADRALGRTDPVLAVVTELLRLADGRVTASEVLDLAATAPVRRKFGFDDDELERLQQWTAEAGARWGLGSWQRKSFGLGEFVQNTFGTALDRILLGVAADGTDGDWLSLALPLDDVDSNDIDLAGRFAEYIDRLTVVLLGLRGPQPATRWAAELTRGIDLLCDLPAADAWQLDRACREIAEAVEHAGEIRLGLSDIRSMFASRLAARPSRSNFRTGELTVCSMVPMRSVPHRVVVLLGLDDDVFPRTAHTDGDDVLAQNPCIGERDSRSEDRQLLLDALLAAQERVLLFHTGADAVTGAARPPAIPLTEIRDVVATMTGLPADDERIVRRHPLQPFDPRNFRADDPFGFDTAALAGARAAHSSPSGRPGRIAELVAALPAVERTDVDLDELVAFLTHPSQGFLRQRLGIRIPDAEEGITDALDIELDGLAQWKLGDRMLEKRLAGMSQAAFRSAEWRRGTLPPATLGGKVLDAVTDNVERLVAACSGVHTGPSRTVDVRVDLGDGRRVTGTVGGVHGCVLARSTYSRLAPKHRLEAWIRLLAVVASGHRGEWRAVTTGRSGSRSWRSTLHPPADAAGILAVLVDLRDRGLCAPLPMTTKASAVYADRRYRGDSVDMALAAARKEFGGNFGDGTDRHVTYLHGSGVTLDRLAADPPRPDEAAWFDEPSRFGVLARRLWEPLLASENQGRP
ncbi:exodeoxyribonuclease V subunit gamma [Rhodococcus sp. Z13]|uniref:Exodeoxyribonuclease V subunit gamma n=1 Tax=Rhodococcus sacchari TaxID=2962047 RepID=A0ACD4DJ55_9NOCA|nr:exodeoxyribonuclease V subunit gamma [Rhodococcus sp. Z13]UYP19998.1 exodeoxyribonuclease V subunit gamma [Rhodococcus sp. Z13]